MFVIVLGLKSRHTSNTVSKGSILILWSPTFKFNKTQISWQATRQNIAMVNKQRLIYKHERYARGKKRHKARQPHIYCCCYYFNLYTVLDYKVSWDCCMILYSLFLFAETKEKAAWFQYRGVRCPYLSWQGDNALFISKIKQNVN